MARRGSGEGTIFKLKNGKWKAEIKRLGKSATRAKRVDAAAWLSETLAIAGSATAELNQTDMLLCDWVKTWLETVKRDRAASTHDRYHDVLESFVVPNIGSIRLASIKPMAIRNLLAELETDYAGTRTLEQVYRTLKTCLAAAVKLDVISTNPCNKVDRPVYRRREIAPFSVEESRQIMDATKSHRLGAIFVLAFHTGMRQGELFGLEWRDVDFDSGKLRIDRQAVSLRGRTQVKPPKTKAGRRTIDLPTICVNALRDRQAFAMAEGLAGSDIVFPTRNGTRMMRQNFARNPWKSTLKRLGLESRGAHHMRHTFATHALTAGCPLHVVSKILGHSTPSVTLDAYSHLIDTAQSVVVDRVAALFAG